MVAARDGQETRIRPKISYKPDTNESDLEDLEKILVKSRLQLWLMIDRSDEIFPRRTDLESRALRGLLRTTQLFESKEIRVKIFLRDDILEQITTTKSGFTALTHIAARQADKLRWSEEQILKLVVKRLLTSRELCQLLNVDPEKLDSGFDDQTEACYRVFPATVHAGQNQSATLRWIYHHTGRQGRRNSSGRYRSSHKSQTTPTGPIQR